MKIICCDASAEAAQLAFRLRYKVFGAELNFQDPDINAADGTYIDELDKQAREVVDEARKLAYDGESVPFPAPAKFSKPIAFNVLPHVDSFLPTGYTKEEMKMENEGRKIMGIPDLRVTCTTVRVPVLTAHSVSINAQFERKITREKARELIAAFPSMIWM